MLERAVASVRTNPRATDESATGASARMKIVFPPPSPRRGPPSGAPRVRLEGALLSSALLALLLGCGSPSDEVSPEPPPGCASDDECADGEQCVDTACVAPSPPSGTSAGMFACSVVTCSPAQPNYCLAVTATATGNESQGYASRNQMVSRAGYFRDLSATFAFDAAGQQGWLTFDLGSELDLDRIEFTGFHVGADPFLTVNTNLDSDSGCAFGFDLDPQPSPPGGPPVLGNDISFDNDNDDFCYGGARPGHANQVAFAIFSTHPGEAMLMISNITLHEE